MTHTHSSCLEHCIRRILADPMVRVVMAADGINDVTMTAVIRGLARDLAGRRRKETGSPEHGLAAQRGAATVELRAASHPDWFLAAQPTTQTAPASVV